MDNIFDIGLSKIRDVSQSFDGSQNVQERRKFNKKIIGVYGSSGGVGTSSFIEELAVMFANDNYSVLIVDGNLLFPFHQLYYFSDKSSTKDSFTDSLTQSIEKSYEIILKSSVDSNISYCYQDYVELVDFIKIDENFKNYARVENKLAEYRKTYDVILIDLCPLLLYHCIEQAFLKSCDYLINIVSPNITSTAFKENVEKLILLTAKNDVDILKIENKVTFRNRESLYLPHEEHFHETYNEAKSFLRSGRSSSKKYLQNFQLIYETIINNLYKE